MKKLLLCAVGFTSVAAAPAFAQEIVGRVISATPVVQQVAVPRQDCAPQAIYVDPQPATSGLGSVVGAIAGGIIGNQIGHGGGRAAATIAGVMGGAMVGNHVEGGNRAYPQQIANCTTQTFTENRTVGYNVTYEYGGREFTVQMPNDPGPTVRLQVTPVGASGSYGPGTTYPPQNYAPQTYAPPVYGVPQAVVVPQTIMPAVVPSYYYRPAYYAPPVSLSFGFYGGGGHRHGGYRGYRGWR